MSIHTSRTRHAKFPIKIGLPPPLDASTDSSRQPLPSRSTMSFLFDDAYYKVGKNGLSPAQNMCAYLGGSAIQTVGDNW